ncbi:MAG: hypothetical protein WBO46_20515 [Caldilineaceae bacterium]
MSSANVRSIQTLTDLKTSLARFGQESRDALQRMDVELRRTQEWLDERQRFWEGQVRRCEDFVHQTQVAVQRCHDSAFQDPYTGWLFVPDCSGPEAKLYQALKRLHEAQFQLDKVWRAVMKLQGAGATFQRQARRQSRLVEKEMVDAQAFLERKMLLLESYAAVSSPSDDAAGVLLTADRHQRGSAFEAWAVANVFGQKRRIAVPVVLNQHLVRVDDSGLGLLKDRSSDNYANEDGSLWDMKAYGDDSIIDLEQLQDYQLMERAGYVFDTDGIRIPITSVNYLFSSRIAAEKNFSYLRGMATAWYVEWQADGSGEVRRLED